MICRAGSCRGTRVSAAPDCCVSPPGTRPLESKSYEGTCMIDATVQCASCVNGRPVSVVGLSSRTIPSGAGKVPYHSAQNSSRQQGRGILFRHFRELCARSYHPRPTTALARRSLRPSTNEVLGRNPITFPIVLYFVTRGNDSASSVHNPFTLKPRSAPSASTQTRTRVR
jgi:hypothetical protein